MAPVRLQCCLNGARGPGAHAALPATPEAAGRDAAAAVSAGADGIHVHAKDAEGRDTLEPSTVDAFVRAVREAVDTEISVTTGAWAVTAGQDRAALVERWSCLPDTASVNWHEDGAAVLATALLDRGIGVEAGIAEPSAIASWAESGSRAATTRVLVEVGDLAPGMARPLAAALIAGVRRVDASVPILLHGEGRSCWPLLDVAVRAGLATRIGFEDTLELPTGLRAADTAALVAAAVSLRDASG